MEDRVYFSAGEVVMLKQDIRKPLMIVKTVDKAEISQGGVPTLLGITCFWFTETYQYQEKRFNTKDLVHYDSGE